MKRNVFYVYLSFVVISACNSNSDKAADDPNAADSAMVAEAPDSGFTAEAIDSFNTTGFANYARKRSPAFDWTKFSLSMTWKEDTLVRSAYKPDKKFFSAYGPFLKWAPDSSAYIDLYSYNVDIRKDKAGKYRGTELGPDTEVSMVHPKTGQKTRLLFLGPGSSVEDALWLNNNNLVLMGVQDYGDSLGKTAAVWKFNIPSQTFELYEMHDSAMAKQLMGYWRNEKLKELANQ